MKDINYIIESNTINDEEKEIKIRIILNELKMKDKDELRSIFNVDAYNIILSNFNVCITGIQKILLDLIELLLEKGKQQSYNNQFFDSFQLSGIINKIEQLVKDKIKQEKKQKKYSEETQQLIRILIQIMEGRESDQQTNNTYEQIIKKNINNLINVINIIKQDNSNGIKNQMNKEELENELKQLSKLIRIISIIKQQYNKIPGQIIKILKEKVSPLIHLNCPEQINCTQRIIIQASSALQELQEAVFQVLIKVSNNNFEFRNLLYQNNNFLSHLAPFIISYSAQFQLELKSNINQQQHQQQSEYSSSPSFISSSLHFILEQIKYNNKHKQIIQTPNLLHSLTLLINYKLNIHINNEEDQQSYLIRYWSRECLNWIQKYGDEQDQSELINIGYGRILIIRISTAGGTEEQGDIEILYGLYYISIFLNQLNNENSNINNKINNNNNNQPSFPAQPALSKSCIEQIEEEGGNEEIESQLINKGKLPINDNIKDYANWAQAEILNQYIDNSNTWRR